MTDKEMRELKAGQVVELNGMKYVIVVPDAQDGNCIIMPYSSLLVTTRTVVSGAIRRPEFDLQK